MSRHAVWLLAAGLAVGVPAVATAQATVAAEAARLAALDSARDRAEARVRDLESAAALARPLDTLRAGSFTLFTDRSLGDRVRPAFETAWSVLRRALGQDTARITGRYALVAEGQVAPTLPVAGVGSVPPDESVNGIAHGILMFAQMSLATRAGRRFDHWSGGTLGIGIDTAAIFARTYAALAAAPSRAVRACRGGDDAACRTALLLDEPHPDLEALYTPADLRAILRRQLNAEQRATPPAADCLAGSDTACLGAARELRAALATPLGASVRTSLVIVAFARGGPGAFGRLAADTTTSPGAQLAAAAGMSEPALLDAWRERVARSAPSDPTGASARSQWTALVWVILLAGIATRSTRWRLD